MIDLYEEFFVIAKAFNKRRVAYALIGGVATAFYAEPRFTHDIDFLIGSADVGKAKGALESLDYIESAKPWTFRSTNLTLHRLLKIEGVDTLPIDLLEAHDERHLEIIRNASRARWKSGHVRVATVEDLVWLKRQRNSETDKVDIQRILCDKDRKNRA